MFSQFSETVCCSNLQVPEVTHVLLQFVSEDPSGSSLIQWDNMPSSYYMFFMSYFSFQALS